MTNPAPVALAVVVLTLSAWAQSAVNPVLHRRGQDPDQQDFGTRSSGHTLLPLEASGEYALGSGAIIDVELQPDRLSGFITRPGDRESDEGTPLTFFFATGQLSGQRLAFTTRQIHGVWFSFEGTIVRGSGRASGQPGYYLLEGTMVLHDVPAQTQQTRRVSLPLTRGYPTG